MLEEVSHHLGHIILHYYCIISADWSTQYHHKTSLSRHTPYSIRWQHNISHTQYHGHTGCLSEGFIPIHNSHHAIERLLRHTSLHFYHTSHIQSIANINSRDILNTTANTSIRRICLRWLIDVEGHTPRFFATLVRRLLAGCKILNT